MFKFWCFSKSKLFIRKIRNIGNVTKIVNGAWHFSYFSSLNFIVNKIKNFSHQEYNKPVFLNKDTIEFNIKNNIDIFNRKYLEWFYIPTNENSNLPDNYEYLLIF